MILQLSPCTMSDPADLPASIGKTGSPCAVPARDPAFPPLPPPEHLVSDNGGNFEGNGCSDLGSFGCRVRGDLDRAVDDALSELLTMLSPTVILRQVRRPLGHACCLQVPFFTRAAEL